MDIAEDFQNLDIFVDENEFEENSNKRVMHYSCKKDEIKKCHNSMACVSKARTVSFENKNNLFLLQMPVVSSVRRIKNKKNQTR